ncbi:PAS domain S-box protein [Terrilactibacillus tamarindi]|nr:PAS domain S-box protein [Terrilactibacillus tamarindi]
MSYIKHKKAKRDQNRTVQTLEPAFFILDSNLHFSYLNHKAERLFNKKLNHLIGKSIIRIFPSLTYLIERCRSSYKRQMVQNFHYLLPMIDNWVNVFIYPSKHHICIFIQTTTPNEHLYIPDTKVYRHIFDHYPEAISTLDMDGFIGTVNHAWENLLGICEKTIHGRPLSNIISKRDKHTVIQEIKNVSKGQTVQIRVNALYRFKKEFDVHITMMPIMIQQQVVRIFITLKKEPQLPTHTKKMKKNEIQQSLFHKMNEIIGWNWDYNLDQLTWFPLNLDLFGIKSEEQINSHKKYTMLVHPDDRDQFIDNINQAKIKQDEPSSLSYRIIRPNDQEIRYIQSLVQPNHNHHQLTGVIKDTTDIIQEQNKLKRIEKLYQLITENSLDVIAYSTPDGRYEYVSSAARRYGYEPKELIGHHISNYLHPDDLYKLDSPDYTNVLIFRFRHKEGHYVWFEQSLQYIKNDQNQVVKVLSISRDISERIETENLMKRSEKLTMAGELAAGIAHEIRNPLTSLKGFLQMMQYGYSVKQQYYNVMESELNRIEMILNELLLLAKPTVNKFQKENVMTLINHVTTLLGSVANMSNVELIIHPPKKELCINCDESQIKQVLINLIKNAIEVMPNGGKVTIDVKLLEGFVMISVTDEGPGIPEAKIKNIGQPFFTTKEQGTGLGLAVSFNIIENHNGKVSIESEINKGTTFKISFPIVE